MKRRHDRSLIFVECLREMNAEEVSHKDDDVLFFTRRWVETVNRGGLCKISDEVFFLFIEIESCVRVFIPKQMLKKPQSDSFVSFDQFLCDNVQKNEKVQRQWAVLSQDIDDNDDAQVLLFDIIKLWVTVRGHSIAASHTEQYKNGEMITTQKSTGLRKSLSGSSS